MYTCVSLSDGWKKDCVWQKVKGNLVSFSCTTRLWRWAQKYLDIASRTECLRIYRMWKRMCDKLDVLGKRDACHAPIDKSKINVWTLCWGHFLLPMIGCEVFSIALDFQPSSHWIVWYIPLTCHLCDLRQLPCE